MTQSDPTLDAHISTNWGTAERVLELLGDRRLLSDGHAREDPEYCVQSAFQIRETMTVMMAATTRGPLKDALREIRAACRGFINAAGPSGAHFEESPLLFNVNLMTLRLAIARQVDSVVKVFGISPTPETKDLLTIIRDERRPGT